MFLRTQRLFLRPAWPEDAAELTRAIGQEAVVRMLSRVPWPYREEHARTWIDGAARPAPAHPADHAARRGRADRRLRRAARGRAGQIEVGYWIEPGSGAAAMRPRR